MADKSNKRLLPRQRERGNMNATQKRKKETLTIIEDIESDKNVGGRAEVCVR